MFMSFTLFNILFISLNGFAITVLSPLINTFTTEVNTFDKAVFIPLNIFPSEENTSLTFCHALLNVSLNQFAIFSNGFFTFPTTLAKNVFTFPKISFTSFHLLENICFIPSQAIFKSPENTPLKNLIMPEKWVFICLTIAPTVSINNSKYGIILSTTTGIMYLFKKFHNGFSPSSTNCFIMDIVSFIIGDTLGNIFSTIFTTTFPISVRTFDKNENMLLNVLLAPSQSIPFIKFVNASVSPGIALEKVQVVNGFKKLS